MGQCNEIPQYLLTRQPEEPSILKATAELEAQKQLDLALSGSGEQTLG